MLIFIGWMLGTGWLYGMFDAFNVHSSKLEWRVKIQVIWYCIGFTFFYFDFRKEMQNNRVFT